MVSQPQILFRTDITIANGEPQIVTLDVCPVFQIKILITIYESDRRF